MVESTVVEVRETKPPTWAMLAPALYLMACAFAIRSVAMDRSIDIGIAGLFVAIGLAPAFAIPAIFATRGIKLAATTEVLVVDGRLVKINDAKLPRAERGSARLSIDMRNGETRTFLVASYKDAASLVAMLPPVSAPELGVAALN